MLSILSTVALTHASLAALTFTLTSALTAFNVWGWLRFHAFLTRMIGKSFDAAASNQVGLGLLLIVMVALAAAVIASCSVSSWVDPSGGCPAFALINL